MMVLSFLKRLWQALPLRLTLVLIVVMWVAEENYPFSHFPMYSDFTEYDYVVYVADQNGNPLPLEYISLGTRTARLKKNYNGHIKAVCKANKNPDGSTPRKEDLTVEQRRPAGEKSLTWLWKTIQSKSTDRLEGVTELQIHQIPIYVKDGHIIPPEPEFIASIKIDGK